MLKQILKIRTALMFSLGLSLFCPGVFAQGHDDGHKDGNNRGNISRDRGTQGQNRGQKVGHGSRHYYHNGNWNRNGWYGWGSSAPVLSDGFRVESLPPGYTTVEIQGNTYFYGNDKYFRQLPAGGYTVVTVPLRN